MSRRVLIIPDKFKGTLTAGAAARAIASGWRRARPEDTLELLPMTDGGDGFGEVMSALLGGTEQRTRTIDAAGRPCLAQWWWAATSRTAIIESATVIGLARLPAGKFHPFALDTFGLGRLFQAAFRKQATTCLVGIGGSATNDAGFGLARALGWSFQNPEGKVIERWTDLASLHRLERPPGPVPRTRIRVAVDVQNPLLGARGATRVYGPQKGLAPCDFPLAESCLRGLARGVRKQLGLDLARTAGAGAAGGLGFGLQAFLGATLEPGFALFAHHARLESRLKQSDLVITGEGAIDRSTLMGKGVGELARRCRALNLPCIGLAGTVSIKAGGSSGFAGLRALAELTSEAQARSKPASWLEQLAYWVAKRASGRLRSRPLDVKLSKHQSAGNAA